MSLFNMFIKGRDTVAVNHSKSRTLELFLVFVISDSWMIHNIHNYMFIKGAIFCLVADQAPDQAAHSFEMLVCVTCYTTLYCVELY